ncbi:MAG: TonB-dependent receptor plug domain-containing protein [Bacteroidia bacterium]|nr:TonB-dependent receptor plug domain-containing protein [Bacteroidia bacterium]
MKYPLIILLLSLLYSDSYAQVAVEGKIFDELSQSPVSGATINSASGTTYTVTDEKGRFELELAELPADIIVKHVSYLQKELKINTADFLTLRLTPDVINISEVEISSRPSSVNVGVAPSDIIHARSIEWKRFNTDRIDPMLNSIPGVYMHSGALNTNRITIRGIGTRTLFSTNKVRAYINDIPLTTGDGETTLEDIDIDLLNSIQVFKGPNATLYGAGLGGTIVLNTYRPEFDRPHSFSLSQSIGSFGLSKSKLRYSHSAEDFQLDVIYNRLYSDGYRDNSQYERNSVFLNAMWFNERSQTSFLAGYMKVKAFIPSSLDSINFEDNPSAAAFTWGNSRGFEDYNRIVTGISHKTDLSDNFSNVTSLFLNFRDAYELRPFNILTERSLTSGIRSRVEYSKHFNSEIKLNANLGGEFFNEWYAWQTYENVDRVLGVGLSDNKENRSYYNIFGMASIAISDWTAELGFNINKTRFDFEDRYLLDSLDQSAERKFDPIFSPRVAIKYNWKEGQQVGFIFSHGFSTPTLEETLNPSGVINPEIKVETGYNFELFASGYIRKKHTYSVSAYTMQVRNLLVARRTAQDEYVGINAGKTRHNGLDASLKFILLQAGKNKKTELSASANYSLALYKFKEFVDEEDGDFSGNELTGNPPHKIFASLDLATEVGIYGSIHYQYIDRMPITDANTIYSEAYSLLSAKAGYKLKWKLLEIDIHAGVNNITDTQYASMLLINATAFGGGLPRYYYPGNPVSYFVGVELSVW